MPPKKKLAGVIKLQIKAGAATPAPLINPWPRAGINTMSEFFALGYKVALVTSSVSMESLVSRLRKACQFRQSRMGLISSEVGSRSPMAADG